MSLLGALVTRYNEDIDSPATALRNAVGTGKAWADRCPEQTAMPYLVFHHISTALLSERKTQDARIVAATVQIDVWHTSRAGLETILDLAEAAFVGHRLLLDTGQHLATYFSNRLIDRTDTVFHGVLDLELQIQKP